MLSNDINLRIYFRMECKNIFTFTKLNKVLDILHIHYFFFIDFYSFIKFFLFLLRTIKIIMTESEQIYAQSQSFLPVSSSVKIQSKLSKHKNKKIKSTPGNSLIYQELEKIEDDDLNKKRQCVIKYLKQEGQMKNTSKIVQIIEQEGHSIPIMQVAIALSRYDNKFLKELMDSKSIELKEQRQSDIYEMNQKLQTDPILSLISDSDQMKNFTKKQNEPSFIDFKQISPKRKNQLIDFEKGRFKKPKVKSHSMIDYPKQLKQLKNDLLSLPFINRYKKQLALKRQIKSRRNQSGSVLPSSIVELNCDTKQVGSVMRFHENQSLLEKSLKKAIERRQKSVVEIPINQINLPKIVKITSQISNISSETVNQNSKNMLETIASRDQNQLQSIRNSQNRSFINPEEENQKSEIKKTKKKGKNYQQEQFWPSYQRFSPHSKRYTSEIQRLQEKVRSLTELSELPSESTMSIYTSLKSLQANDLKKLQKQSYQEQKIFSNTKYRIKYKNLKQGYYKRLKQFMKDRKIRQFELQQNDLDERSNMSMKVVKLNDKMLEKMVVAKN